MKTTLVTFKSFIKILRQRVESAGLLSNGDAIGSDAVGARKRTDFPSIWQRCKSEISVLLRKSGNLLGAPEACLAGMLSA